MGNSSQTTTGNQNYTGQSNTTGSSNANTSSTGSTGPWEQSQGLLTSILGKLGSVNTGTTTNEQNALDTLRQNALSMPNYGGAASGVANELLSGGPNFAPAVQSSYDSYAKTMSPYLNPNYTDPTQTPGMANVLATIRNDVGNNVNSMFAGAGRDLSGVHQQELARGIAQGEAQPLLNQYNQNVAAQQGAASGVYNAGNTNATLQSQLYQTGLGNKLQGLDVGINTVPTAMNANANALLNAEAQSYALPLQKLGLLEGLTIPIAGMGSTSSNTGSGNTSSSSNTNTSGNANFNSTTEKQASFLEQLLQASQAFKNFGFGGMKFGSGGE